MVTPTKTPVAAAPRVRVDDASIAVVVDAVWPQSPSEVPEP